MSKPEPQWEIRYNLGRSRAGGWDAPDGWHCVLIVDGKMYQTRNMNTGKCNDPYYDQAEAQRACDKLNGIRY